MDWASDLRIKLPMIHRWVLLLCTSRHILPGGTVLWHSCPQVGRTTDDFSRPNTLLALFASVDTSQQGTWGMGVFSSVPAWFLCVLYSECVVTWASSSDGKLKARQYCLVEPLRFTWQCGFHLKTYAFLGAMLSMYIVDLHSNHFIQNKNKYKKTQKKPF